MVSSTGTTPGPTINYAFEGYQDTVIIDIIESKNNGINFVVKNDNMINGVSIISITKNSYEGSGEQLSMSVAQGG